MNFERDFTSEFVINNLPADQRELLLLKDIRNSICDASDVTISVRGRHVQPRSDGTLICDGNVKPLYLLITAKSKHNLTQAMKKIQHLLQNNSSNFENWNNGSRNNDVLEEKITVGIDVWPVQFDMKSKVLGENDEFVRYIESETGALISLRGRGSNYANDNMFEEPLYVHVSHNDITKKDRTHELVLNLVETVQKEFLEKFAMYYAHPKKAEIIPIVSQNKVPDIRLPPRNENLAAEEPERKVAEFHAKNDTDKILIGFDYAPRNFDLKDKIYGPNCAHVKHIEKEGGAMLLVHGRGCRYPEKDDSDEPPHLIVKYKEPELKAHARDLIFNLLETVHNEFIQCHGTYPIKPEKPRIVPIESMKPKTIRDPAPPARKMPEMMRRSPEPPVKRMPDMRRRSPEPPAKRMLGMRRGSPESPASVPYTREMPEVRRRSRESPASYPYDKKIPDVRRRSPFSPGSVHYAKGMSEAKRRSLEQPESFSYDTKMSEMGRNPESPTRKIPMNRRRSPERPASKSSLTPDFPPMRRSPERPPSKSSLTSDFSPMRRRSPERPASKASLTSDFPSMRRRSPEHSAAKSSLTSDFPPMRRRSPEHPAAKPSLTPDFPPMRRRSPERPTSKPSLTPDFAPMRRRSPERAASKPSLTPDFPPIRRRSPERPASKPSSTSDFPQSRRRSPERHASNHYSPKTPGVRRRSREPPSHDPPSSVPYDANKSKMTEIRKSREPYTSPRRNSDHSRRGNTPPKSSRSYPSRSDRSRSPVVPPPPPVISKPTTSNVVNASDPLPPIIPPFKISTKPKSGLSLTPSANSNVESTQPDETFDHSTTQTSQGELNEPIQDLKSPGFYLSQSQQQAHFASSFTPKPNFKSPQYIKTRSKSPESTIKNEYHKSSFNIKPEQQLSSSSMPFQSSQQNNNRGKKRSGAGDQTAARTISPPDSETPFNGYAYGSGSTHQFAISTNLGGQQTSSKRNRDGDAADRYQNVSSDSEDATSIICIDSEDEYYRPERPTSPERSRNSKMCNVKVQTENEDEVLRNKKLHCTCGRFTHFLSSVRSRATQTDPERYCRF